MLISTNKRGNGPRHRNDGTPHGSENITYINDDGSLSISLDKGQVAIIDAVDWPLVRNFHWYALVTKKSRTYYAASGHGVRMHRLLLSATTGQEVDHEDRNGLNNRRNNIRVLSHGFNVHNQGPRADNRLGLKGVYAEYGKFRAQIRFNGKIFSIGTFTTPQEAARAYDAKAKDLYGDFATSSFPQSKAI